MKRRMTLPLACLFAVAAQAEPLTPQKSLEILTRVVHAARGLNYTGTYVYQRGSQVDSFQLVHIDDDKGEAERRESLDGPPKLMLLDGDRITCYMPDAKYVNLDRHSVTELFPDLLPDNLNDLLSWYRVEDAPGERVAGMDANVLWLQPRDQLRYPYKLWYDNNSGLLLKAAVMSPQGPEALEMFAFTQVDIVNTLSRNQLRPHLKEADFKAFSSAHSQDNVAPQIPEHWDVHGVPAGFRLVKVVRQQQPGRGEKLHLMYSDGLAPISIFIEPLQSNEKPMVGMSVKESTHILAKVIGSYQLIVLGEAPEATIMQFANAVSPHDPR